MQSSSSSTTRSEVVDDPTASPAGELLAELFRLFAVQREIARVTHPAVTPQMLLILGRLGRHGPQRTTTLAEALAVDVSVISRQITTLVQQGYVERGSDPDDGRAQLLTLTTTGRQAVRNAYRQMVAHLDGLLEDWDESRIRTTSTALRGLREQIQ